MAQQTEVSVERLDELVAIPSGAEFRRHTVSESRVSGVPLKLLCNHAHGLRYTTTVGYDGSSPCTLYIYRGGFRSFPDCDTPDPVS